MYNNYYSTLARDIHVLIYKQSLKGLLSDILCIIIHVRNISDICGIAYSLILACHNFIRLCVGLFSILL